MAKNKIIKVNWTMDIIFTVHYIRWGKRTFDLKQLQQKQNLLRSIIHVFHNIILKIAPWPSGHYDVIDEIQNGGFWDILVVIFINK